MPAGQKTWDVLDRLGAEEVRNILVHDGLQDVVAACAAEWQRSPEDLYEFALMTLSDSDRLLLDQVRWSAEPAFRFSDSDGRPLPVSILTALCEALARHSATSGQLNELLAFWQANRRTVTARDVAERLRLMVENKAPVEGVDSFRRGAASDPD